MRAPAAAGLTFTMSRPPMSSPFTYSWGYVGQLEYVFNPCRTYGNKRDPETFRPDPGGQNETKDAKHRTYFSVLQDIECLVFNTAKRRERFNKKYGFKQKL